MRGARTVTAAIAAAILISAGTAGFAAEAPFGDKVDAGFTNYNRAAPSVGSAGLLGPGAVAKARALGFRTIVDLRGPAEGTAAERAAAKRAGIAYINIPITTTAPTPEQVAAFARAIEAAANQPVLAHCHSANRVGAMWALYRAGKGVPGEVAVEEGRTLGLSPSREGAVRARLGLAPMTQ